MQVVYRQITDLRFKHMFELKMDWLTNRQALGRPNAFQERKARLAEIEAWCWKHLGPVGERWSHSGDTDWFALRDDDDAFEFRLRWC